MEDSQSNEGLYLKAAAVSNLRLVVPVTIPGAYLHSPCSFSTANPLEWAQDGKTAQEGKNYVIFFRLIRGKERTMSDAYIPSFDALPKVSGIVPRKLLLSRYKKADKE